MPSSAARELFRGFRSAPTKHDVFSTLRDRDAWEDSVPETSGEAISFEWEEMSLGGRRWLPASGQSRGVLVWFHGGGFVSGSSRTHGALAGRLADETGLETWVPDYPLAPEARFATTIQVCSHWLLRAYGRTPRVFVGGDSAGAAVALSALRAATDVRFPDGVIFLSPWIDLRVPRRLNGQADPLVNRADLRYCASLWASRQTLSQETDLNIRRLPVAGLPTIVFVSRNEYLVRDARILRRLGAEVVYQSGLWHVWPLWSDLPETTQTLTQIREFVDRQVPQGPGLHLA